MGHIRKTVSCYQLVSNAPQSYTPFRPTANCQPLKFRELSTQFFKIKGVAPSPYDEDAYHGVLFCLRFWFFEPLNATTIRPWGLFLIASDFRAKTECHDTDLVTDSRHETVFCEWLLTTVCALELDSLPERGSFHQIPNRIMEARFFDLGRGRAGNQATWNVFVCFFRAEASDGGYLSTDQILLFLEKFGASH